MEPPKRRRKEEDHRGVLAEHADIADLAERAHIADLAEVARELDDRRKSSNGNGTGWVKSLLAPPTLVLMALAFASIFGSWMAVNTRMAVLENRIDVELSTIKKDAENHAILDREALLDAIKDRNERITSLEKRAESADGRLWADITELRRVQTEMMIHK